jgi:predicted nucleic acid-binding protein
VVSVDRLVAGRRLACLDSNFVIYLIEGTGETLRAAREVWDGLIRHRIALTVSQLCVAECLIGPFRREDRRLQAAYTDFLVASGVVRLQPLDFELVVAAARLAGEQRLKLPDAIHLKTAMSSDCDLFVTNDRAFSSTGTLAVIQLSSLMRH